METVINIAQFMPVVVVLAVIGMLVLSIRP